MCYGGGAGECSKCGSYNCCHIQAEKLFWKRRSWTKKARREDKILYDIYFEQLELTKKIDELKRSFEKKKQKLLKSIDDG